MTSLGSSSPQQHRVAERDYSQPASHPLPDQKQPDLLAEFEYLSRVSSSRNLLVDYLDAIGFELDRSTSRLQESLGWVI